MGIILSSHASRAPLASAALAAAVFVAIFAAGCHPAALVDTKPLDSAGMSYDSIQQLKDLKITVPEIMEVATARQAGFSDAACIEVFKLYRGRNQAFDAGDDIAGLMRARVSEDAVLEIARLNELGPFSGELEAMRLAGLSDAILLEVTRHRAAGQPVLAGASLADLKNSGMHESTLLELVKRGIPDSQAAAILSYRRHGASDAQILKHFS
jgi:hypothetical protein